ncbi:MAG TPA: hypothetical protein VJW76_04740 [Verrucomicrobiae bacterium]|nr:hypothetical protein [Verrucomicrobiae bacterium]
MSARHFAFGLFCLSAALLGYELLLMRLLSLSHWGHFAGLVISIALLGLAASGVALHLLRERIVVRPGVFFSVTAGLFGVIAPAAFGGSQLIPFKPFLLAWSAGEYLLLALRVLIFFVPFCLAGIAIGVPFVARILPARRLYLWNMLGSAALVPLLSLGMGVAHPVRILAPVTLLGIVAAVLTTTRTGAMVWIVAGAASVLLVATMPFRYSEYKDLSRTLNLPESKILDERYDPKGVVHSVESRFTRYLPGLSLNFAGTLPRSELVFGDGSSMEVVFDADASLREPAFLRMSPEAFSYQLASRPRVLSLYAGPVEILRALAHDAATVVSVDDLTCRADAVDRAWQRLGTSPFRRKEVRRGDDEARHFLAATHESFDLIIISMLGSHGSSTAGAASLDLSGLFTLEGVSLALDRLSARGHAAFSTWVENPPRTGVRLAALIVDTLRRRGVADPARHILALRSWSTLTFFVAREPYRDDAIERLRKFAAENSFDLVFYAGMPEGAANQFNVIPDEPYFRAMNALSGPGSGDFRERWPFQLASPRDDHPFFNHHFRWKAVPAFVSAMGNEWIPFVEWGYLLQVASLLVTGVLGVFLLIVPCAATRARPSLRGALLFFVLGVGYMFVEIWAIYKLTQLLSSPTVASTHVLTIMLAASGAGAAVLARAETAPKLQRAVPGMIVALLLLSWLEFPALTSLILPQSLPIRVVIASVWIAVPAFFMGFPFPFALGQLRRHEEIPWALALNGLGSVLGSLGATLVAVHCGLTALALAGAGSYVLVGVLSLATVRASAQPARHQLA